MDLSKLLSKLAADAKAREEHTPEADELTPGERDEVYREWFREIIHEED